MYVSLNFNFHCLSLTTVNSTILGCFILLLYLIYLLLTDVAYFSRLVDTHSEHHGTHGLHLGGTGGRQEMGHWEAVKQAAPSRKVWCSRLESIKTSRHSSVTLELRFLRNSRKLPSMWISKSFGNFYLSFLRNGKRLVFHDWKQDFFMLENFALRMSKTFSR